jgi:ornithine cyclodeaminase/alanine dehydrogenase-like protein (mu-crystallin family)
MAGLRDIVILDHDDVARLGDYLGLVDALEAAHRELPAAVERIVYGPDGRDEKFLALPAWQADEAIGIKLVTVFPDNPTTNGLPSVQAVVVLFDGVSGEPLALIDGTELTYRKTAADSALGSRFLSRADSKTLLMVGAGGLAAHLVAAHRAVRPSIERVLVWNRTPSKAAALVESGVADSTVDDLEAAVAEADIICTATMTKEPLVRGDWLRSGTHVDCVGAYLPDHREIDDEVVRRAAIYVDSRLATLTEGGDLVIPLAAGVITTDAVIADLYELSRGVASGRADAEAITLFENCGGGHLDLMVARHLWHTHQAR